MLPGLRDDGAVRKDLKEPLGEVICLIVEAAENIVKGGNFSGFFLLKIKFVFLLLFSELNLFSQMIQQIICLQIILI